MPIRMYKWEFVEGGKNKKGKEKEKGKGEKGKKEKKRKEREREKKGREKKGKKRKSTCSSSARRCSDGWNSSDQEVKSVSSTRATL